MSLNISRDEYKTEHCTITDVECVDWDCSMCPVGNTETARRKQEDREDDIRQYTCFERNCNIRDVFSGKMNHVNTIAKMGVDELSALQDADIVSKTESPYNPVLFKQYETLLRKLRQYNCIVGTPDKIYIKKNWPGAFVWGDVVYLIAPKTEEGDE